MIKTYASALLVCFLTFSCFKAWASSQLPDYLVFKSDTVVTYSLLVEEYFQKQDKADQGNLFGLSFRQGASLNCWRGYQAIYHLDKDSLFLVAIIDCDERSNGRIDKAASVEKMKTIFNDKLVNGRVYIDWFSGQIKFPLTYKPIRWDGVFYTIYEKENVVSITNGRVLKIEQVKNYVDDPMRINRKDKSRIPDILFDKLKRSNWKNKQDFDCSEKYKVTIDENGKVSKVTMLYSQQEMERYYEKEEYAFCISKVYNALRSLRFDIIKDQGKPIAEDIYIEIWVEENGKLENWTY